MNILKNIFLIILTYYVSIFIWALLSFSWYFLTLENRLMKIIMLYLYSIPSFRSLFIKKNELKKQISKNIYMFKCKRALYLSSNYSQKRQYFTKKIVYLKLKIAKNLCIVPICFRKGTIKSVNQQKICKKHWRMTLDLSWFIVFVWRPAKLYINVELNR